MRTLGNELEQQPERGTGFPPLFLILIVAALTIWATWPLIPFDRNTGARQAGGAELARTLAHVGRLANAPHPVGSTENAAVRAYILEQLRAIGYAPAIQNAVAARTIDGGNIIATVNNVVVRVPGSKKGKALALVAHYDSVRTGPGAADNAASVAVLLETLRAVSSGAPLSNDVIAIFTDGEEAGLLGAEAFVAQHPWRNDIGLVLNFEYRGNSGPMLMFETTSDNGNMVAGLQKAAPSTIASSLFLEAYRSMPNDTDMGVFRRAGIPGINFAAIGNLGSYHSRLDNPAAIDASTLNEQIQLAGNLVKHFGNLPLASLHSRDSVYFNLPGIGVVAYDSAYAIPLLVAFGLAFLLAFAHAVRSKRVRVLPVLFTVSGFVVFTALAAVGLQAAVTMIPPIRFELFLSLILYSGHWYFIAFAFGFCGLLFFLLTFTRKWLQTQEVLFGMGWCWLLLAAVTTFVWPGASYLFLWPLAGMAASQWVCALASSPGAKWAAVPLAVVPVVVFMTPIVILLYIALRPVVLAAVIALALLYGALLPFFLGTLQPRLVYRFCLAGTVAFFTYGILHGGFDAHHPRPSELSYVHDASSGKAMWVSQELQPGKWARRLIPEGSAHGVLPLLGKDNGDVWYAPAPHYPLPAGRIEILEDKSDKSWRDLALLITPPADTAFLQVSIDGAHVESASAKGMTLASTKDPVWRFFIHYPGEPFRANLRLKPNAPFTLRLIEYHNGLPGGQTIGSETDMMPEDGFAGNMTEVVTVLPFAAK